MNLVAERALVDRLGSEAEVSARALSLRALWVDARYLAATIRSGNLGDHAGAIDVLEAVQAEIRAGGDSDQDLAIARLAPRWVRALAFLDRTDEARRRYEAACGLLSAAGDDACLARLHADMAGGLWRAGDYEASVEAAEQARQAYARAGVADSEWLPTLGQIEALALQSLGRLSDAEAAFVAIVALCDVEGDAIRGASARTNLARVYYELGQPMRALELLDAARRVFVDADIAHLALMVQLVRMDILTHLQRHRDLLVAAATLARADGEALPEAPLAREALDALSAIDLSAAPAPIAAEGHRLRARALRMRGDVSGASAAVRAALASLDLLVGRIALGMRGDFLVDHDAVYGDAVMLALAGDDVGEALELAERAKSRALVDALAHGIPLGLQPRSAADARAGLPAQRARATGAVVAISIVVAVGVLVYVGRGESDDSSKTRRRLIGTRPARRRSERWRSPTTGSTCTRCLQEIPCAQCRAIRMGRSRSRPASTDPTSRPIARACIGSSPARC